MPVLNAIKKRIIAIFKSADMPERRPALRAHNESSIRGLYVIGDLAGAPVIKLAMEQGFEVVNHIAGLPGARGNDAEVYDLLIVGAGAAGLNAALAAKDRGLRCIVIEKNKIANTIENFPEGKWVYAEPDTVPPKGKLWLDGARKEDLIHRWHQIIQENALDVRVEEGLQSLAKEDDGIFRVQTEKAEFRARRVVLATGQRGDPRKLGAPGEDQEKVYHMLYSPRHYHDENILVVGGGNSAAEAALTLSEKNRVILSYRGDQWTRLFKDNDRKLADAVRAGRIRAIFNSNVTRFGDNSATLSVENNAQKTVEEVPFDHAFVLIGAEFPGRFLKSLGLKLENEWNGNWLRALAMTFAIFVGVWIFGGQASIGFIHAISPWVGGLVFVASLAALIVTGAKGDRFSLLGISFFVCYTIYGVKINGPGDEYWPYTNWGYNFFSIFHRPASFWYTVLYTVLMTVFGIQALKRWGLDRKDKFQIWRYASLISFQWTFFFLIPEFLFDWAVKYQWIGARLAHDPTFADQSWRSYGLVYAWPLFFYTFIGDPSKIWVVWGVLLAFVILPVFALWNGKRYCSWICGCGGLAETFGDRWRHLAPKGKTSQEWERMNAVVLAAAAIVTVALLAQNNFEWLRQPTTLGQTIYHIAADVWLVGIIPVTLYPFLGGKIWCRYWCPLAKMMELFSRFWTRLGVSRYRIEMNDKCIVCMECSRNCLVGINVMQFALKQEPITNSNSSCIGCGICVTVCPMDVLSFGRGKPTTNLVGIKPMLPQDPASAA